MKHKYLIGIDEAGRGPLAGPVAVGAVFMSRSDLAKGLARSDLRDSKQLTALQRDEWFEQIRQWRQQGKLDFAVALVGQKFIDARGIVPAIRLGIARCLERLDVAPTQCRVLLDGGLKAPTIYAHQQTIIRGDETEPIIALASIVAKITRDRRMARLATLYPGYQFDQHKGYGTMAHYAAIRRFGLSPLHRRSFTL